MQGTGKQNPGMTTMALESHNWCVCERESHRPALLWGQLNLLRCDFPLTACPHDGSWMRALACLLACRLVGVDAGLTPGYLPRDTCKNGKRWLWRRSWTPQPRAQRHASHVVVSQCSRGKAQHRCCCCHRMMCVSGSTPGLCVPLLVGGPPGRGGGGCRRHQVQMPFHKGDGMFFCLARQAEDVLSCGTFSAPTTPAVKPTFKRSTHARYLGMVESATKVFGSQIRRRTSAVLAPSLPPLHILAECAWGCTRCSASWSGGTIRWPVGEGRGKKGRSKCGQRMGFPPPSGPTTPPNVAPAVVRLPDIPHTQSSYLYLRPSLPPSCDPNVSS